MRNPQSAIRTIRRLLFNPRSLGRKQLQERRGFTLLELLVACAILSLVLAALYGVFSRTLMSLSIAEEHLARARAARITLLRIGEDLQASFPLATRSGGFAGETSRKGPFPKASLSFVSAAHTLLTTKGSEGDLCRIGYDLVPDPVVPTQYRLVRRTRFDIHTDSDVVEDVFALLPQVRGLRFRFFDGQSWIEEWGGEKTQGRLPQAVEVTLYLDGSPEEETVFSTVVALPLAGARRFGGS